MNPRSLIRLIGVWCFLWVLPFKLIAAEYAWLKAAATNSAIAVQIHGPDELDWFIQMSPNLHDWTALSVPPLWSHPKRPPVRVLPSSEGKQFFRIRPTSGLFETNIIRRVELTFAETNWNTILRSLRSSGSNHPARLALDNGIEIPAVGARYKGWGSYNEAGRKRSFNLEVTAYDPKARLLGLKTINLNNHDLDLTMLREPLYCNIFSQYAPSPRGSFAWVIVNGATNGLYALVEQANKQLLQRYFATDKGDRWRTPNWPGGDSGLRYFGTNISAYTNHYELRSSANPTNAWKRLVDAIIFLNRTDASWDALDSVFALDTWIWFVALESVLADPDSYVSKGADYAIYYEFESERFHPIQHDGNEAMSIRRTYEDIFPVGSGRPLLDCILTNSELRQRYVAHARTIMEEALHPSILVSAINAYTNLSWPFAAVDPNRRDRQAEFETGRSVGELKAFVTNRYNFLSTNREIRLKPPTIISISAPSLPKEEELPAIKAVVEPNGQDGISSVWLYWRDKHFGRFTRRKMLDDGVGADGVAGDNVFTATTTNYPPNTIVQYYIEARSGNADRTSCFSPVRAERQTHSYRVALPWEE